MLCFDLLPCAAAAWPLVKFRSRLLTALNLLPSMATIASVNRFELAAQHDELAADVADGLAVVLAEVGDGLEVRHQAAGQPHQLDVALRLALQAPARLDAVEVAVDVDLQQHRRVVRRSARRRRLDALKAQLAKIQLIDEDIDDADRVVFGNVVVQTLGQQRDLAFDPRLRRTRFMPPSRVNPPLQGWLGNFFVSNKTPAFLQTACLARVQSEYFSNSSHSIAFAVGRFESSGPRSG